MDYGTLANIILAMITAGVGGLAWLFKLHGDVRVLKADLFAEGEMRRALSAQFLGFEERIFTKLDRIESKVDAKADR